MNDDPDIVKELREEEQLGTLYSKARITSYDYDNRFYADPSTRNQEDQETATRENMIHVSIDYERRLMEAEEKYEKIFRLSPEAIVIINKNGVIVDIIIRRIVVGGIVVRRSIIVRRRAVRGSRIAGGGLRRIPDRHKGNAISKQLRLDDGRGLRAGLRADRHR